MLAPSKPRPRKILRAASSTRASTSPASSLGGRPERPARRRPGPFLAGVDVGADVLGADVLSVDILAVDVMADVSVVAVSGVDAPVKPFILIAILSVRPARDGPPAHSIYA